MPHLDPERLALMALGEQIFHEDEATHVDACPQCTAELAQLQHTVAVGRASIDGTLEAPSPRVWDRISEELGLAEAAPIAQLAPRRRSDVREASGRRVWVWVLGAAAAVALVVGIGVGVTAWIGPAVTPLASATLDALPEHPGARGSAALDERPDGSRVLTVSLDSSATPGYREVWLMTPDAAGLISLGLLDGDRGDFVIPRDIDLNRYRLVDVSAEAVDGDPGHSGDSIVRGQLHTS